MVNTKNQRNQQFWFFVAFHFGFLWYFILVFCGISFWFFALNSKKRAATLFVKG